MKKLHVLGTGCLKCQQLEERVRQAVEELGLACEVAKVSKVEEIVKFGVMMTPALVVDGEVKCMGRVPTVAELKEMVK